MNETMLATALRLRQAGKLAEAAAIYSNILREQPGHFEALHALGIVAYQTGELDKAERLIGEAIAVNPRAADALYNRGSLLLRLNRVEEALSCFDAALLIKPDYAEALGNRGTALMQLGRHAQALADFERLVQLKPALPQAWGNRASALMKLNRLAEARASYSQALILRPDFADARKYRGAVAFRLGAHADALADADAVLASHPGDAMAWELRANALAGLGRQEEAMAGYEKALALNPANADAFYNRANNLMALRRFAEAAHDHAQALKIDPDYPYARGYLAFCKLCACEWADLERETASVVESLDAGKPLLPFHALVLCPGGAAALAAARSFTAHKFPPAPQKLWNGEVYRHQRIRVAYLSANFHDHAVARLMAGVFEHHHRARFETLAFSFGPDDGRALRARLTRAFDRFIDVRSESPETIAQSMRRMEIDIAVDLMGFTETCRPEILSHRPAPVQVNYLGYPGTMGAEYIDYIIADATVLPPHEQSHYAEKVVSLPHSYLPGDNTRAIAQAAPSRAEAGLPDRGFVFCCFNHTYKIVPAMFDIWMGLLREVEGSVLWLSQADTSAAANLRREAAVRGVAPGRLVFANFVASDAEHLARLKLADLFLDTLPYNAHATASDALWAGVPVLTVPGAGFPGRVAASLLKALHMEETIASSLDAYRSIALKLARDPAALSHLKAKLAGNRDAAPLFDTARFTRELERAYTTMWARSQQGLPPESFAVESAP